MKKSAPRLLLLAAASMLLVSLFLLRQLQRTQNAGAGEAAGELLLYAAAGLSEPVNRIVEDYARETGRRLRVQFGGSGELLAALQVSRRGDLFLAGDESFIASARERGLTRETFPVSVFTPVIAVKAGNPRGIRSLEDLAREDLRVGLGDPRAAAVGVISQAMLEEAGLWETVEARVRENGVFRPTVNGLALDVANGPIDAAIVFDAVAAQFQRVEAVAIPVREEQRTRVTLAVLESSGAPAAALHFARYLTATDRGGRVFAEMGFTPVPGDVWKDVPEVTLFSGSVNRPSVDEAIRAFEAREGVRVNTVYNGCGILVSQMRAGDMPDAYFACDTSYMQDVWERFRDHRMVSATDMVILTAPGNPKNIHSLADLANPGVRVAISNPDYSALGGLTHALFRATGFLDAILPNVTFGDAPTGDIVVTRVRTGREDAGIVYRVNTLGLQSALPVLEIDHPRATAAQPIAIQNETPHPRLMERLVDWLTKEEMRERYEASGFVFKVGTEMPPR